MLNLKEKIRVARHKRIRKRVKSSPDCPRLCVHRSLKNLYFQVIDDKQTHTMFSFSTLNNKQAGDKFSYGGNIAAAGLLGVKSAEKLKQKGINKVVFDRGGYIFHGRIKALAEGLKKGGIVF